jgi:hypothetical protein
MLTSFFLVAENNNIKMIMAALWVTEGANRCVIGHVPEKFSEHFHLLEGRIAQVYTIFHLSKDANKMAFSNKNDGVCHAILVDKVMPGDELLDPIVETIDSASDSE